MQMSVQSTGVKERAIYLEINPHIDCFMAMAILTSQNFQTCSLLTSTKTFFFCFDALCAFEVDLKDLQEFYLVCELTCMHVNQRRSTVQKSGGGGGQ